MAYHKYFLFTVASQTIAQLLGYSSLEMYRISSTAGLSNNILNPEYKYKKVPHMTPVD